MRRRHPRPLGLGGLLAGLGESFLEPLDGLLALIGVTLGHRPVEHEAPLEYQSLLKDLVLVSEYLGD